MLEYGANSFRPSQNSIFWKHPFANDVQMQNPIQVDSLSDPLQTRRCGTTCARNYELFIYGELVQLIVYYLNTYVVMIHAHDL